MAKYSDIDLFLQKNDITNDISFKQDVHAVAQSIKNIVLTRKGEGYFDSEFGSSLLERISSRLDNIQISLLKDKIKAEIESQESRATINSIQIIPNLDTYEVEIYFSLISLEQQGAVSFTV